jgi:hypothetical protein
LATHWRVLISIAILAHLTAVIAAPMAVGPSSQLQQNLAEIVHPYLSACYLNHGYRFFCPEPGPGHLIRYQLEGPDESGKFPDKQTEWPRLFYHRHFMLSEKLANMFVPEHVPQPERTEAMKPFEAVAQSYADHLLEVSGAHRVTLELVSHELPSPDDMTNDRPLDDRALYRVIWKQAYEARQP